MSPYFKPSTPHRPKVAKVANRVRIIGGTWRSRAIEFPDADGLRPTANRVRETLFNWLGQTLHDKHCLDLFSGSGALGFEAASRGATEVLMLETQSAAVGGLKTNQKKLAATQCRIVAIDALTFLHRNNQKFDIVFIDPPFASNLMRAVLSKLPGCLAEAGVAYAEWCVPLSDELANIADTPLEITKHGKAGAVHFALLRLASSYHPPPI